MSFIRPFDGSSAPSKLQQQPLNVNSFFRPRAAMHSASQQPYLNPVTTSQWFSFESAMTGKYSHYLKFVGVNMASFQPNIPVDTRRAYELLSASMLNRNVLSLIWSMANRTIPGQLTVREFCLAIALVGLAQKDPAAPLSFEQLYALGDPPTPFFSPPAPQAPDGRCITIAPNEKAKSEQTSDDFGDFKVFDAVPSCSVPKSSPVISDDRKTDVGISSESEKVWSSKLFANDPVPQNVSTQSGQVFSFVSGNLIDKKDDVAEPHIESWLSLVRSVLELVSEADNLLKDLDNKTLLEVLCTKEACAYVLSLGAAISVSKRIMLASQKYALSCASLSETFGAVLKIWEGLSLRIKVNKQLAAELECMQIPLKPGDSEPCGICLQGLIVNHDGCGRNPIKIVFGGATYHAECANLWVNRVDSLLPGLNIPALL